MARTSGTQSKGPGRIHRVASAVKGLFTRSRGEDGGQSHVSASTTQAARSAKSTASTPPRTTRRETDIPLDVLDRAYNPPMTSSKASFRSDGADHQLDQEYAFGVADDRWNDEDRLTNKSGDPRIGTHRRTYEPGEDRAETRD